jgi:hypothetical protein
MSYAFVFCALPLANHPPTTAATGDPLHLSKGESFQSLNFVLTLVR